MPRKTNRAFAQKIPIRSNARLIVVEVMQVCDCRRFGKRYMLDPVCSFNSRSRLRACRESGTICSSFIFIRVAGIRHSAAPKSNSSHRAARSSIVRTNVSNIRRRAKLGTGIAAVTFSRRVKSANNSCLDMRTAMFRLFAYNCAPQRRGRVMLGPQCRYCISKDCRAPLADQAGVCDRTPSFDALHHFKKLCCLDARDGKGANVWEYVSVQDVANLLGISCAPTRGLPVYPFGGDRFERIFVLVDLIPEPGLPRMRRMYPQTDKPPRFITSLSSAFEGDMTGPFVGKIFTDGKDIFFASDFVTVAPQL